MISRAVLRAWSGQTSQTDLSREVSHTNDMPPAQDPRRVIGAPVHALARHITHVAQCQRPFGSLWKDKTIEGEVREVKIEAGKRIKQTFIVADWAIGFEKVPKAVRIRRIRHGYTPVPRGPNGVLQCGREPERDYPFDEATSVPRQEIDVVEAADRSNSVAEVATRDQPIGAPRAGCATLSNVRSALPSDDPRVVQRTKLEWGSTTLLDSVKLTAVSQGRDALLEELHCNAEDISAEDIFGTIGMIDR